MPRQPFASIPIVAGLGAFAGRYDALLCDVWGVLHNGAQAHGGVVEALKRYRGGGGRVLLLSNSPRPSAAIPAQLEGFGIPADAYDGVVTSGDATRSLLDSGELGRACYHLGPDRDLPLFDGVDMTRVPERDAEFVLCSGLFDDEIETPDDYREQLGRFLDRNLVMVCANPDVVVERGAKMIYCAGAIARLYEELGGDTRYLGKPYAPIYQRARVRLGEIAGAPVADARILAVGDGALTDIAGANAQKIDALFITGGIAWEACGETADTPDVERVARFCGEAGVRPVAAMPRLVW